MKIQIRTIITLFCLLWMGSMTLWGQSPKREVRAVWLTTIGGLDWPKQKATSPSGIDAQKQEFCKILDCLAAAHFNTILFQTRVRSTVLYPSTIEPWDECLTGHAGRNPGYDPLAFAIEECHKRKMELHAWVVTFPGNNFKSAAALGQRALQKREPSLCLRTNEFWMLNPGVPATADYMARLCREIVDNYDVDGIHLDYVRYPEKEIRYNDAATFRKYGRGQNLSAWRRENINHVVRTIHQAIKDSKPWVRFSCSPIGKFSDVTRFSSRGWNAFTTVFQDAQGWLREGIMDMLVPMMYFEGDHFYPFAADWIENSHGRLIVPGMGAYLLADRKRGWPLETISREDYVVRHMGAAGQAYFRSQFIMDNVKGIYDFLKTHFYDYPALTPALSWEHHEPIQAPVQVRIETLGNENKLHWEGQGYTYNIYRSYNFPVDIEKVENLVAYGLKECSFPLGQALPDWMMPYYAVTAMDRFGNESEAAAFNQPLQFKFASYCTDLLLLDGQEVVLPPKNRDDYIVLTDEADRIVWTRPYAERINISLWHKGIYTLRSLGRKGKTHHLGKIIK